MLALCEIVLLMLMLTVRKLM